MRKDFKNIDKNEEITSIFGYFYGEGCFPIVMDGKKPWGVVDERKLIKSKLSGKEKLKDFVVGVPKIDATYSISKSKEKMKKSGAEIMIVTSGKNVIGYITVVDIAKKLGIKARAREMMEEKNGIEENMEIGEAINIMRRRGERILPVVGKEIFLGVIGVKNILKLITTHEKITDYHQEKISLLSAPVKGFMESGIITSRPSDEGRKIIKIMEKQGFAVVCKNRKYMGMIEPSDLLKFM